MPVWKPFYVSGDIAHAAQDGFYNYRARRYPLSLVTPVSVYRQHSSNDDNPMLREECYRHCVWMSGVDAKARGIKDGDTVRVFSETGEMELAAYVTNRMTPGTAAVHHGAWYQGGDGKTMLDQFGMDHRGAPNILLDDTHLPNILGTLLTSGLVEIEKVADGDDEGFGPEGERAGMRGAAGVLAVRQALGEKEN
jgi:anaerobic dimethyl sulfoxide reductase subunit A